MISPGDGALTPGQQNLVLLVWYAFLALFVMRALLLAHAGAVSLEISGASIGQGVHSLNFSGNVSASLIQGLNNSSWQVLATGGVV